MIDILQCWDRSHKERTVVSFLNNLTSILSQNSQVDFLFDDFNINALKDSKESKDKTY